jgi:lipoyl(octanoyl) transferase
LAAYPILPLERLGLGLDDYRTVLETSLLDLCAEQKIPAFRRDDEPGAWGRGGQLAHLGVAVKSWISYHGLFLNVAPAMDWVRLVQPNASGERVSSLAAAAFRPVGMHSVREALIRNLAARLGYERYHLYTGHPLLRRTRKVVAYA